MAMSFGRFLARNIFTLAKANPLPLCRLHAINRFIDNPLKAAAIGIRNASSKAKTATAGAKGTAKGVPAAKKKKTAAKTTSKRGTATKSKSTALKKKKKPAAKKKPAKEKKKSTKELTPEQVKRQKKRMLKEHILTPPKVPASNPYSTFMSIEGAAVGADAAKKWKALTPEQQREYAEKGRNLHALGLQNREKWVKSLDPLEVYKANKARKHLKRLSGGGRKFAVLKDPRMPKRPTPIGAAFLRDQWNAGTFINPDGSKMPAVLALKHSRDLYEKLSAAEKKVYDDQFAAERVVYKKAMAEFLGDISKL